MKTVAITGTSRGIGLALTNVFLDNGWKVIAIGRHMPAASTNPNVRIEQCDLTDGAQIAGLYDATSVDDPVATTDFDHLTNVFRTNTIAPKLLSEALVPNLQAGTDKLVVSITSGMGTYALLDEYHAAHWAYGASKAALNYAMVSFSELHTGIKAALVSPGWVQTAMGGSDAPLPVEESVAGIYDLIANHPKKLLNGEIVDYTGKRMDF
jgi:NAD(P)-dependent dehydrogenase (short-subunit alcohol dehydrogenase family)